MKNVMIALMLLTTVAMTAQRNMRPEDSKPEMSVKEKATLATKKATLALALDASQSERMYPIILAQIEKKEAQRKARATQTKKPSKEDRLKMANAHLDEKITMQRQVKAILNEVQFEKWQKHTSRRERGARKDSKRGKSHRRN